MQGLITAAGLGTRANTGINFRKVMLPIYDVRDGKLVIRPLIDCIVERMKRVSIKDIVVVLDPSDSVTIQYIKSSGIDVSIEYQKERRGFGDAVRAGSKSIDGRFLLNAGDGILTDITALRKLKESRSGAMLALMKVKNPRKYGIAEYKTSKNGLYRIIGLEEKPQKPKSNMALAAVYALDKEIIDHIGRDGVNIEFTDALRAYMLAGNRIDGILLHNNQWLSVGEVDSYVKVLKATFDWVQHMMHSNPTNERLKLTD
ncbi:MAG: nucleotidyltransferase family protein [Candidatus Micrarchaeia archaeon]